MKLIQGGPRDARICIVGEAPGATEESSGVPFSGGSGELLNRMLSRVGISRSDCFVTNLAHVRPPGNDFDHFLRKGKIADELVHGVLQLRTDLQEIRPHLVIALGARPLQFLTGKQGIDKWRGSVLECTLVPGLKVIATYHPAYILRIWDYKAVAEFDLAKCAREAKFPEIIRPKRDFYLNPDRATRAQLVEEMSNAEWLAVDIECTQGSSGKWHLSCVGFSDVPNRALVIAMDSPGAREDVARLCACPAKKVMQNGTFDCTVLESEGIAVRAFTWDTMLAHHSLYPECASGGDEISVLGGKKRQSAIAKGLGFLTSVYTSEPYYKDDGKLWAETGDLQMFWRYNALDAAVTREIRDVQARELSEFGTMGVFQHEMSLVRPLMDATSTGVKIDLAVRQELRVGLEREILNLQALVDAAAGGSLNVKSSKQVQDLLYGKLGLPVKRNRDTGNPTANADAIESLAAAHNHPILHAILQVRERRDLVERYLNAAVDSDGRMRCNFDITGTRTGRLSSRASLSGSGTNLQNIPNDIRRMFIPDAGKIFVYRDYSQAEARVVAYLAEEEELIELFNDPLRDVHKENAARIFGKSVADVSSSERYLAKRVIHASNYGMGANRLVDVVNSDASVTGVRITRTQADKLLDAYFMLYPRIREIFWKEVEREIRQSRTLVTPFGRKRTFFGRFDDKLLKEAYAYIPQSTVGDLCCRALVNMAATKPEGVDILLTVHDSILVQCREADVDAVADWMGAAMAIDIPIKGRVCRIQTDCKTGYNWQDSSDKNPRGLTKHHG